MWQPNPRVLEAMSKQFGPNTNVDVSCPSCSWIPPQYPLWACDCANAKVPFNTFETRGKCPHCEKQWEDTACIYCGVWSKHGKWYLTEENKAERKIAYIKKVVMYSSISAVVVGGAVWLWKRFAKE